MDFMDEYDTREIAKNAISIITEMVDVLSNEDTFFNNMALISRKMLNAYMKQGFSREEAFMLVQNTLSQFTQKK